MIVQTQVNDECRCKLPFELFAFLGEKENPDARSQWTKLINGKDSINFNKVWLPNKNSRVCSKHFVDLKPTEENSNPLSAFQTILNNSKVPNSYEFSLIVQNLPNFFAKVKKISRFLLKGSNFL